MATPYGGSRLGTRFGPYEIRSVIGVGGMGEVYRAYDTVKGRMVALKLLRKEMAADPSFQERFRRESRVAARLQEPHVIPVHDFGEIDGVLFIDMRLVEGVSLKDDLRARGPMAPRRAASVIAQVAAALDAAHADGLVHRDIKPENVLLNADDFAYLVDFGIAHTGGDPGVTSTGMIVGSAAYMAPERFDGGPVGPPADVYSLSCLLFECLTGRSPFETGDLRQLMSAHMFAQAPRPSIMRRGVPRAFDDVVARGMAKEPADRYPSAGELAKAATAATSSPAGPSPLAAAPAVPPPSTRQFSAVYPNPAATGLTPYPPAPPRQPATPPAKAGVGRGQVALIAAIIILFGVAAVLAVLLAFDSQDSAPTARTPLAPTTSAYDESAPTSTTTPTTTTTTTTTTTSGTSTTSSTPTSAPPGITGADGSGFVGQYARCESGSTAAAMVRTAQSLAVICEQGDDRYYYRGQRLSDGATVQLGDATPAGDGFDVVDPAGGTRYEVRPDRLTIVSNGRVDSSEPVLEYYSG